jgi:hemoglobin/transferrin/lactoferrin receptor protein
MRNTVTTKLMLFCAISLYIQAVNSKEGEPVTSGIVLRLDQQLTSLQKREKTAGQQYSDKSRTEIKSYNAGRVVADKSTEKVTHSNSDVIELDELEVEATRIEDNRFDKSRTITTVSEDDIERTQPTTIFDLVRDVPGISVTGSPRPGGMQFNIRGYTDTEDVTIKVDGAFKGIDKYRLGGTFIEPELIKSVEIQRGPQIASGTGALGGTVIATTKSAADYLDGDKQYGGRAKFGYGNNNDEFSRSYIAYAMPHERVDLLYNYTKRDSNNITRADGSELGSSAIASTSQLFKLTMYPIDELELTTSITSYEDSSLQAYDTTGGQPGNFGNTFRTVDDKTYVQSLHYVPDSDWIDLKATIAKAHTNLEDFFPPGLSPAINDVQANCDGIVYIPDPTNTSFCRGNVTDTYKFKSTNIDITNTATLLDTDEMQLSVLTGFQYLKRERDVTRFYDNSDYILARPDGYNPSTPVGTRTTYAAYIQPDFKWGRWNIIPGVRFDEYAVEAEGGTLDALNTFNEPSEIVERFTTFSLGLIYDAIPNQLSFFSNTAQGVRPPLFSQYFSAFPFTSCLSVITPSGPASQICGDLYKPETSDTYELGANYQNKHLFDTDLELSTKLTLFYIDTKNIIESFGETNAGEIVQRGEEERHGVELESNWFYHDVYSRLSYSSVSGSITQDERRGGSLTYNVIEKMPLYTAPANTLSFSIGYKPNAKWDVNLNYRKVWSRTIVTTQGGIGPREFGTQDGYELFGLGLYYAPSEHINFRLVGENLFNKPYNLDDSFSSGPGIEGPGRNIKFYTQFIY